MTKDPGLETCSGANLTPLKEIDSTGKELSKKEAKYAARRWQHCYGESGRIVTSRMKMKKMTFRIQIVPILPPQATTMGNQQLLQVVHLLGVAGQQIGAESEERVADSKNQPLPKIPVSV